MMRLGLSGGQGMFVTMMVGGVVCTALASAGALSSDLKIDHWIGATPARQLGLKFAGTLVAATFCGMAMWLLSQSGEGFGSSAIPAPQASAMREILVGIFGTVHQPLQWSLFSLGVIFAVILRIVGVPALAFALGMYLPMQLNTPVLLGGILSWVVGRRRGDASAETASGYSLRRRHRHGTGRRGRGRGTDIVVTLPHFDISTEGGSTEGTRRSTCRHRSDFASRREP